MKMTMKALVAASAIALLPMQASSAVVSSTGLVTSLRLEGTYGFIGIAQPMGTCLERVWVDMTTSQGRAVYSTALAAFMANKKVTIRAAEESARVFNVCNLYDIYLAP